MINVEGNYEEIVKWLDDQNGQGICHAGSHGGEYNVGLFSVVKDRICTDDRDEHTFCIKAELVPITLENWDRDTFQNYTIYREHHDSNLEMYGRQYHNQEVPF